MTTTLTPAPRPVLDARPTTAEGIAAAWLHGYANASTRRAYERDLQAWGNWLAAFGVDPLQARRAHVDAWARTLEAEGRSPATVARALSTLSGFYAYAADEGAIDRSPVANVRRPTVGEDSPTLGLESPELAALLDRSAADPRSHALVLLLALNGLRISEALRANIGDLGSERGHRTLTTVRKGGRRGIVPLAPRTGQALDGYLAARQPNGQPPDPDAPLFATRTGRRLDPRAANRTLERLARRAGVEKRISAHSLRHTFVTMALDAGASLRDVQDAAGHADPRTTRRYDRGRHNLDRHPTYAVAAAIS